MMTERDKARMTLIQLRGMCEHWLDMVDHGIMPARSNFITATGWINETLSNIQPHTAHALAAIQEQSMQLTDQEMAAISAARGMT